MTGPRHKPLTEAGAAGGPAACLVVRAYTAALRGLVFGLAAVSGTGILVMVAVTCTDVLLRAFGHPLVGAFDLVKIAGAVTITCALPYTTAVKGHVAIEYFFLKLSHRGRIVVDSVSRLVAMGLFAMLCRQSVVYGTSLRMSGVVTPTLQLPLFWVPYVIPEPDAQFWKTYLYEVDDVDAKARQDIDRKIADAYLPRVPDKVHVETVVRIGRDYDEILTFADREEVDLIVIGRQGRSAFRKVLFGNVTEKVARRANCPVLIIPLSFERKTAAGD